MEYLSLGKTPVNLLLNEKPHGWIQFKGTDICMDVHCKCGELTHVDGSFVYFVECSSCGTVYELNGHIELIERVRESLDEDIDIKKTDED